MQCSSTLLDRPDPALSIKPTKALFQSNQKRPLLLWITNFLKGLRIVFFIRGHLKLGKTLKPLYANKLLSQRVRVYYLFKYLSSSLTTDDKLKIIDFHYSFLQTHFPFHLIQEIYNGGLTVWCKTIDMNTYHISLESSSPYEREGPLLLKFNMNGIPLYRLGFSFSPGESFGFGKKKILVISRVQGALGFLKEISVSTKVFDENKPSTMLVSIAEGIALALGFKAIIGICTANQLSPFSTSLVTNYDKFWETYESSKISSGDYSIDLPIKNKNILLIKSKHRQRTLKKRNTRNEISLKGYEYFYSMNLPASVPRVAEQQ